MFQSRFAIFCAACMSATVAVGHEFWIEPARFQIPQGSPLIAELKNGQEFAGTSLSYYEPRFDRFDIIQGDRIWPVQGRAGDLPALTTDLPGPGLWAVIQETRPQILTYTEWEKFQAFADHKDFPDIAARHAARDLPMSRFIERYTRHAKALVAVDAGIGADRATGMQTEFVALANPYTDPLDDGLPVRLLYQGAPRPDAQVEIFDRAPDGTVQITLTRTDPQGEAMIPVRSGHRYLLDAVVLRPADAETGAAWRTLWAALTFAVP